MADRFSTQYRYQHVEDGETGRRYKACITELSQRLAELQNLLHAGCRAPIPPIVFPEQLLLTLSQMIQELEERLKGEARRSQTLWDALHKDNASLAFYKSEYLRLRSRVLELENYLDSQGLLGGLRNEESGKEAIEGHGKAPARPAGLHLQELGHDSNVQINDRDRKGEASPALLSSFYTDSNNSEYQAQLREQRRRVQDWRVSVPQDLIEVNSSPTSEQNITKPEHVGSEVSAQSSSVAPPNLRASKAAVSRRLSINVAAASKPTWSELMQGGKVPKSAKASLSTDIGKLALDSNDSSREGGAQLPGAQPHGKQGLKAPSSRKGSKDAHKPARR